MAEPIELRRALEGDPFNLDVGREDFTDGPGFRIDSFCGWSKLKNLIQFSKDHGCYLEYIDTGEGVERLVVMFGDFQP